MKLHLIFDRSGAHVSMLTVPLGKRRHRVEFHFTRKLSEETMDLFCEGLISAEDALARG